MGHLEVKKCETCGKTKHISEFSKSYRNRCKVCVAEHTREVRAAEKRTARLKPTGKEVEVMPNGTMSIHCAAYKTKDGRMIPATALEFEKEIDWNEVLIQAAISALPANISQSAGCAYGQDPVYLSIEDAKRMVEHLKEELKKGVEE